MKMFEAQIWRNKSWNYVIIEVISPMKFVRCWWIEEKGGFFFRFGQSSLLNSPPEVIGAFNLLPHPQRPSKGPILDIKRENKTQNYNIHKNIWDKGTGLSAASYWSYMLDMYKNLEMKNAW